ncbi:drug resistance transporter, EmrB/QacA subfamily [Paenibacillus sp. UNC496MF]|uniref:DHA2 family efflux MFS transporter permease subunit n=1 Tax=Paenibacillus sp. UNC496MF TaxID=1502753 RepID=UPI0008E59ECB|nr:DHA2 family efflux MFS transporter permease subunit [Paenibacillus sp. UNC496MF]SFJ93518.1 drug resistance transporter, EmrB/QacA subfamily [Paenibacillus sp. UNC496MF]
MTVSKASKHTGLIVLSMALGLLMASLDNTIVSASVNKVIANIGGFDKISWVFTAYMLAATSTMLIFGKLSDLFGRKKFYLIGIALFLIGSALCGMAQTIDQLIWFRVIQGVGSGSVFPISFSIIFTLFGDPKQAAKLSGVMGAVFGLSSVAGPQLGTLISEHFSWRWCFYVNLPIGLASMTVLLIALRESKAERKPSIDYLGALLLVVTTVSVLLALESGGKDYAWASWQIIGLFALGAVGAALFLRVESKAEEPMLPLAIFKNRLVLGTSLLCFCQGFIMFSAITYLPLYASSVLGKANSNGVLTPMMASLIGGAILAGFIAAKFRFRTIMAANMVLGVLASVLLMNLSPDMPYWQVIGIMILLGLGVIGPLMSMAQNAVAMSVDRKYIGISSSVVGFWRNIGGVMGASIMAVLVNASLKDSSLEAIDKFNIPADQAANLTNPETVLRGAAQMPADLLAFMRNGIGAAISHGFILSLIVMAAGALIALTVGGARLQKKPDADGEQPAVAHSA